jgi:hypothetical protein
MPSKMDNEGKAGDLLAVVGRKCFERKKPSTISLNPCYGKEE